MKCCRTRNSQRTQISIALSFSNQPISQGAQTRNVDAALDATDSFPGHDAVAPGACQGRPLLPEYKDQVRGEPQGKTTTENGLNMAPNCNNANNGGLVEYKDQVRGEPQGKIMIKNEVNLDPTCNNTSDGDPDEDALGIEDDMPPVELLEAERVDDNSSPIEAVPIWFSRKHSLILATICLVVVSLGSGLGVLFGTKSSDRSK